MYPPKGYLCFDVDVDFDLVLMLILIGFDLI